MSTDKAFSALGGLSDPIQITDGLMVYRAGMLKSTVDQLPVSAAVAAAIAAAAAAAVATVTKTSLGVILNSRAAKTATYTVVAGDQGKLINATSGTWSLNLTAAATLADGFAFAVFNSGSGVVTIDPASTETIRDATGSATTKTLAQGEGGVVICDGTGFLFLKNASLDSLTIHGADIASASTVNLDAATGDLVDVTGTTTVTAITLAEGRARTVRFTGALVLTHGSSLVLPGAATITTAAGDFAIFRGYAAGVVRCVGYQKASGLATVAASAATLDTLTIHGADVASASTVNLDTATGDLVDVTGTTAVTAITLTEGRWRTVRFTGILTLTHGSSLVLPGAANITTAAGDFAIFRGYAAGVVRCVGYQKASGLATVAAAAVTLDSLTIHGADVASASTVNLDTATGDLVDVTGTTTVTAITLTEGRWRTVRFTGALILTNGSSLLLPGAANITTVAGDFAIFRGYAAGVVRCVSYQRLAGTPVTTVPVANGGTGATTVAGAWANATVAANTISSTAIDWALGPVHNKTLGANTTFTFSNATDGQTIVVALTNTASNYTVTWPTVVWTGGAAPTQTTGAKTDIYTFIKIGSTIYGSAVQNMS